MMHNLIYLGKKLRLLKKLGMLDVFVQLLQSIFMVHKDLVVVKVMKEIIKTE